MNEPDLYYKSGSQMSRYGGGSVLFYAIAQIVGILCVSCGFVVGLGITPILRLSTSVFILSIMCRSGWHHLATIGCGEISSYSYELTGLVIGGVFLFMFGIFGMHGD